LEYITRSEIITHRVLNDNTGELETKDFKQLSISKNIKGGFNLIYHKRYEDITEEVVNSKKDIKLFNWVTNQFTYRRIETPIVYSICTVEVSQSQFAKFIKKLVKLKYILRVSRGIYRLNPFMYVPFRADAVELQKEWRELTNEFIR